jgi:NAD(P)-dependent dehydrogenase (short-subunit alcohol dehydrogenase family)
VNLDGAFYLSRAFMEDMKRKRWGRIENITSLAAKTGGITAGTAYSVSKGALISLTFSLAAELASYGLTVHGIAPAYIKTPMITVQTASHVDNETSPRKHPLKQIERKRPLMSLPVMIVVLVAALLHASWNFLVKRNNDKHFSMSAVVLGHTPFALIALLFAPRPSFESMPYILEGAGLHVGYQLFLLASYRIGDLS